MITLTIKKIRWLSIWMSYMQTWWIWLTAMSRRVRSMMARVPRAAFRRSVVRLNISTMEGTEALGFATGVFQIVGSAAVRVATGLTFQDAHLSRHSSCSRPSARVQLK